MRMNGEQVFSVDDFAELKQIQYQLLQKACKDDALKALQEAAKAKVISSLQWRNLLRFI